MCFNDIRINSSSINNSPSIDKKMFGSDVTTLIISSKELNDIMEIVKSLEESGLFIRGVSRTTENELK